MWSVIAINMVLNLSDGGAQAGSTPVVLAFDLVNILCADPEQPTEDDYRAQQGLHDR